MTLTDYFSYMSGGVQVAIVEAIGRLEYNVLHAVYHHNYSHQKVIGP